MCFFIIIFNSTIWGALRNLAPFVKFIKHDKTSMEEYYFSEIPRWSLAKHLLWHSSSKNSKQILLCIVISTSADIHRLKTASTFYCVIFTISQNAPTCQSSKGFLNSSNMQPSKNWEEVSVFTHFIRSIFVKPYSLNTKLNTHKTFRRRSEDALNVFWTSLISSIYVLCLGSNPDAHFEQKELYMRTLSKKDYIFFNSESYYRAKIS